MKTAMDMERRLWSICRDVKTKNYQPHQHPRGRPKPKPKKGKKKRKQGGQKGHAKYSRELIATEECNDVIPCIL